MIDLTTLEGQDTPGKVRALCAKAHAGPTRPTRPVRRSPRSASTPTWSPRPSRRSAAPASTSRAVATAFPSGRSSPGHQAAGHPRRGRRRRRRDRHGDRPRRLPRPATTSWCSTRSSPSRSACGERAPEGDHGDRRAGHLRQRPTRVVAGDAGRRRLHQDHHRQDPAGRDAAGHADHARGGPRLPRGHRPAGRRQAGRRHQHREGRDQVPRHGQRDRRRRLARPGLVPLRRVQPAQRPADAAHQARPPAATPVPTTSPSD